MTTRIFLIRHGDTAVSAGHRFTGAMDVPLSKDGRTHASELATRLSAFDIQGVYSSSMQRAHDTAQYIANVHSLEVVPLDALRELNHGKWDGLTSDEVEQQFPGQQALFEKDPLQFRPEGGESGQDVLDRAVPAITKIVADHSGQDVVVVAHYMTNLLLICHLLEFNPNSFGKKFGQHPACVNVLEFDDDGSIKLLLLNDISHYRLGATVSSTYVA